MDITMRERVTLVIPTRNRPDHLFRSLLYYSREKVPCRIVVADSSDEPFQELTRARLSHLSGLDVQYWPYPADAPFSAKLIEAVNRVTTPLLQLSGDDDLFVPQYLKTAADVLDNCPDYACVVGDACVFTVRGGGAFERIESVARYPQRSIEQALAGDRVMDQLARYSTTWYALQRTAQWRSHFTMTASIDPDNHFIELLQAALVVASGKVKKLDGLAMARQQVAVKGYSVPDPVAKWRHSPDWRRQADSFAALVGRLIADSDGTSTSQAETTARRALDKYVDVFASRERSIGGLAKSFVRRWPTVLSLAYRFWRLYGDMGLPALRNVRSRFHAGFQPIDAVVGAIDARAS